MKKGIVVFLAVMLMAGMASAQIQFGVGGGISKLTGDGSELFKMGFNGRVTAFQNNGSNLQFGGMAAYNTFKMDTDEILGDMVGGLTGIETDGSVNVSIIEIIAAARYFMSPQFYLQAGGGYYMMKGGGDLTISYMGQSETFSGDDIVSENKPGVSLGAGFNMGMIGVAAYYNIVFTEEESTKYFTVNVMIGLN